MLRYKTDLMRHIHTVKVWCARNNSLAYIDLQTLILHIKSPEHEIHLRPQFVTKLDDGRMGYSPQIGPSTVGFVGWLPYQLKVWSIAQDKLEFKVFARKHQLRTPKSAVDSSDVDFRFIIKQARSSFGYGIRGPYTPEEASLPEAKLESGEYYEELVFGKIARAWYWNSTLAALEVFDMPKIRGDGQHSIKELIRNMIGAEGVMPTKLERIAAVQGVSPDEAIPTDMEIVADYRYVSALNPSIYKNFNVLNSLRNSDVVSQFEQAGQALVLGIPEEKRLHTASVVDAIVDNAGTVWLLEMNCNAQLHPDIYGVMLDELCRKNATPLTVN